jgi:hypothetical protein
MRLRALEREDISGGSGEYQFLALPPGIYSLTVEKDGFGNFSKITYSCSSILRLRQM